MVEDSPDDTGQANDGIKDAATPILGSPFRFHSGEKLTITEASEIMAATPVKVILCAGAQWAGKTTFMAKIGEMFRNGSFKEYLFAGSKTLCAFERVSWLATLTSGVGRPETLRSYSAEKDTFFHIRVQSIETGHQKTDILISDLPGEVFPLVLGSRDTCREQLALARADHVVLFLDGRCLADNAKRHSERDNACLFLGQIQRCRDDSKNLAVCVVFSRWDFIVTHDNHPIAKDFCDDTEKELRSRFGDSFGELSFARIAARPEKIKPTDKDIQNIFAHWLKPSKPNQAVNLKRNLLPARDFCAFGLD